VCSWAGGSARRAATRRTGAREVRKLRDPAKVARSVRMAVESFRGRVPPFRGRVPPFRGRVPPSASPPARRPAQEDKSKAPLLVRRKAVEESDE